MGCGLRCQLEIGPQHSLVGTNGSLLLPHPTLTSPRMLRTKGQCFSKAAPGCNYSLWKWQPEDLLVNKGFWRQDTTDHNRPEWGAETESRRATRSSAMSLLSPTHGAFKKRVKSSFLFSKVTWKTPCWAALLPILVRAGRDRGGGRGWHLTGLASLHEARALPFLQGSSGLPG